MKKNKKEQVITKYIKAKDDINEAYNNLNKNIIKLGEYFYKLKKEVGHGNFISTIENEYGFISIRNVQIYISAYKKQLGD